MELKKLGPYLLKRPIGKGGMGTVYEAVHEGSNETAAVKSLITSKSSDAQFRRRFEAEILTLTHLRHPNIVRILSHGQDQGHLFFAMQLVDGCSLYDRLKERGPMPWAEVVGYTLDICEGLKHAHDRGFIHRDLKPGNLLLDQSGRVLLTDFGIARDAAVMRDDRRDQITSPGGVVGTLDFMSPEQLHGEASTIRSDLYSLGCVMYALLAGRTPFTFKNIADAQTTIGTTPPTRLGLLVPNLPARLEKIIMRMLEAEPSKRYGSALAVTKRLNEFLEQRALEPDSDANKVADDPSDEFKLQDDGGVHTRPTLMSKLSDDDQTAMSTRRSREGTDRPGSDAQTNKIAPTKLTADDAWGAEPKPDYFSDVAPEDEQRSWDTPEVPSGPIWPYVAGLSIVFASLLVGLYWTLIRQPTADSLYATINAAVQDNEDPATVEDEIETFIARFPEDPRCSELESYKVEIEARSLPRRLSRRLQYRGTASLSDVEREFLHALRLSETDPAGATERLQAMLLLYGEASDSRTDQILISIRQQLVWLEDVVEKQTSDRRKLITQTLETVSQPSTLTKAEQVQQLESLLVLFQNDPTLNDDLDTVRSEWRRLTGASPNSTNGG